MKKVSSKIVMYFLVLCLFMGLLSPLQAQAATDTKLKRHVVLVLDTSADARFSHSGVEVYRAASALSDVKEAARIFVRDLFQMQQDTKISVVSFSDTAKLVQGFSSDADTVQNAISSLTTVNDTRNLSAAIEIAYNQLESVKDIDSKKTVVIISPGLVNAGESSTSGHWDDNCEGSNWYHTATGIHLYAYANAAYDKAQLVKNTEAEIYTIGTFRNLKDVPDSVTNAVHLFENTLRDIATDKDHFYYVTDVSELSFAFGDISGKITSPSFIDGTFKYSSGDDYDYSSEFHYRDDYFISTATSYNRSLATMSLCLAMSAFATNEPASLKDRNASIDDVYKDNYKNAEDLLKKINFSHIEHNPYYEIRPTTDSVGVIAGLKTLEYEDRKHTVLVVAVRGAGYEAEWGGNFKLGTSGDHVGFSEARDKVKSFIEKYLTDNSSAIEGELKIWVTGFSRGAAIANMFAGLITENQKINGITLRPENIYAYCFECPQGKYVDAQNRDSIKYKNIHNIINPNDMVPNVAMSKWGFYRYGIDENVIPDTNVSDYETQSSKMMKEYIHLNTDPVLESSVSSDRVDALYNKAFKTIEWWAQTYFENIKSANVYKDYTELEAEMIEAFLNKEDKYVNQEWPSINIDFDRTYIDPGTNKVSLKKAKMIYDYYYYHFSDRDAVSYIDLFKYGILKDINIQFNGVIPVPKVETEYIDQDLTLGMLNRKIISELTDYIGGRKAFVEDIQPGLIELFSILSGNTRYLKAFEKYLKKNCDESYLDIPDLLMSAVVNAFLEEGDDYKIKLVKESELIKKAITKLGIAITLYLSDDLAGRVNDLYSLYDNISLLGYAHYPELCFAWLRSQDPNYTDAPARNKFPLHKRIIKINCPVDVSAYDSNGNLVAEIIDNKVKDVPNSSIVASYTANGEKVMYLPEDEQYEVVIKATDDGKMDISLGKTDLYDNDIYLACYDDISIKKDDIFRITLNKEFWINEDGSTTETQSETNVISGDKEIAPSFVLSGDDIIYYNVSIENDNKNGGTCYGGGEYIIGSYARVYAANYDDCEFEGWYENGVLVSTDKSYRFKVTSDINLEAKFNGETAYGHNGAFEITVDSENGGAIISHKKMLVLDGYPVEIECSPFPGYKFVKWEADGDCIITDANAPKTTVITTTEDVNIKAIFVKEEGNNTEIPQNDDYVEVEGIDVIFKVDSKWNDGSIGTVTITNNSGKELRDWYLSFGFDAEITQLWNAQLIENTDKQYLLKNVDWNASLKPGESLSFGFIFNRNDIDALDYWKVLRRGNTKTIDDLNVEFVITSEWNEGLTGEFVISNNSAKVIKDWSFEFDSTATVNSIWNGKLGDGTENHYVISYTDYNSTLMPGGQVRVGINMAKSDNGYLPGNIIIQGVTE